MRLQKLQSLIFAFCLCGFVPSANIAHADATSTVYSVSLLELITNPDQYDGKMVQVTGVFQFYFSDSALFGTTEWFEHDMTEDAVAVHLDVAAKDIDRFTSWTGKYVRIQGVFDLHDHGHLHGYAGALKSITDIKLISTNPK